MNFSFFFPNLVSTQAMIVKARRSAPFFFAAFLQLVHGNGATSIHFRLPFPFTHDAVSTIPCEEPYPIQSLQSQKRSTNRHFKTNNDSYHRIHGEVSTKQVVGRNANDGSDEKFTDIIHEKVVGEGIAKITIKECIPATDD